MKILAPLILFLFVITNVNAQKTTRVFVVFETQEHLTHELVKEEKEWKQQVPFKEYVRIVIASFDIPNEAKEGPMRMALDNQLAEFIYENYLPLFEKFKLHTDSYKYLVLDYTPELYESYFEDCEGCKYEKGFSIIEGFYFEPKKSTRISKSYKQMHKYLVGNEWTKPASLK